MGTTKKRSSRAAACIASLSVGILAGTAAQVEAQGSCAVRAQGVATTVVELYTSEGCSSCPPADSWLAKVKPDSGTVALAFHVDYWDRLGWKDRFSSAEFTRRQAQEQLHNGARFSYTPQVVVNGADRKDWHALDIRTDFGGRQPAGVQLDLRRDGGVYTATVQPLSASPLRLAAYWAVTEQGHVTSVKAGENSGAVLRHEFVVREYMAVEGWSAKAGGANILRFTPSTPLDPAHARQVNLVVIDGDRGRPVQAAKLGC